MALSALLKNRPYVLTMLGLLITAQSVLWEYVRVQPRYRFVIEPWSIRGYTTPQGLVVLFAAIWLMVLVTLMVTRRIKETPLHSLIAVGLTALVPVVAAVVTNAKSVVLGGAGGALVSLLGAVVVSVVLARFVLSERITGVARFGIRLGLFVASLLILILFVLKPLFGSRAAPSWLVFAIIFGLLGVLVIVRPPVQLAVWRTLINSVIALWFMTITMAASLRWDLLHQQFAEFGVNAELGDIQITSGILLCWFGGLLAVAGVVSLWAKRRDLIAARDRARHQQEAARESQEQLAEMLV